MRPLAAVLCALLVCPSAASAETRRSPPVSANAFLSADLKAEQADEARNRGMLWVEQGQTLWQSAPVAGAKACASCHGETPASMKGVATRYPKMRDGRVVNLEGAINTCRTTRQNAPALAYDSQDLLSLTALVAHQSRGLPMAVDASGSAAPVVAAGRAFYETRQGQLNLACTQCHDDLVGRKLRGDTISGGVGTGYPAYRLEWQGVGSLYRRLRACQIGVRAEPFAADSDEHLALELYLAVRASGLPVETPALRR